MVPKNISMTRVNIINEHHDKTEKQKFKINKNFQRKIVNIFLLVNFNICFGCSKEPSH